MHREDDTLTQLQTDHLCAINNILNPPGPGHASYLPPAELSRGPEALDDEPSTLLEGAASPLEQTVDLLVGCHRRDLDGLEAAPPARKGLMLYR